MILTTIDFFNIVKFLLALLKGQYVTITELGQFLNFLLGTHTITPKRVNKFLCATGHQCIPREIENFNDNVIYYEQDCEDMYYVATISSIYWREISIKSEENIVGTINHRYLKWNLQILNLIFDFSFDDEADKISRKIIEKVKEFDLIDSKREIVDMNILKQNLRTIKRLLELEKENTSICSGGLKNGKII